MFGVYSGCALVVCIVLVQVVEPVDEIRSRPCKQQLEPATTFCGRRARRLALSIFIEKNGVRERVLAARGDDRGVDPERPGDRGRRGLRGGTA